MGFEHDAMGKIEIALQRRCGVTVTEHAEGLVKHHDAASGHERHHTRGVVARHPTGDQLAQSP